jgi:hypothetical protein
VLLATFARSSPAVSPVARRRGGASIDICPRPGNLRPGKASMWTDVNLVTLKVDAVTNSVMLGM